MAEWWHEFRRQMPVAERWAYFDHAAVAPLSLPAKQALADWADEVTNNGDANWSEWRKRIEPVRKNAAKLLGCQSSEVAFIPNTTSGLSIIAEAFPWQPGDNVVLLPAALSRFQEPPEPNAEEAEWLAQLPRPLRVVAIGGATKYWQLSKDLIASALTVLRGKPGGSLIVVTSRRTNPEIIEAVRRDVESVPNERLVEGRFPRFAMLLGQADEIHVTADSISMLSEAILARKKVGLIPIDQNSKGRRKLGPEPLISGRNARRRDLRRFWHYLRDQRVIGTVDQPLAASIANPNDIAATALRALLPIDAGNNQPR